MNPIFFIFLFIGFLPPALWAKKIPTPTPAAIEIPTDTPTETPTAAEVPYNGPKLYTFDAMWGSKGSDSNQLNGPEGIDISPSGKIVIADTGNNRIVVWDENGKPYKTFGAFGTSATWRNPPEFDHPSGVFIHPSRHLYVADTLNHRVVVLDEKGLVLSSFGTQGNTTGKFNLPRAVAKDHFGNIWVLDSGNSRVEIFSGLGEYISTWGSFGADPGLMNNPQGFALNFIDQTLVADTGNFRMQVFNANGVPVTFQGWFGDGPDQFKEPGGIAMTKDGLIAITDGFGRVEFFNHRFEFIGQWIAKDEILTANYKPKFHGIAADTQGRFYITDNQNGAVIRIKPIAVQDTPIPTKPTPTQTDNNPYGGNGFPIR